MVTGGPPARYTTRQQALAGGRILHQVVLDEGEPLCWREAPRLWETEAAFRAGFMAVLARAPFQAFRLETPCLTRGSADGPLEFVLVDAPELQGRADPEAFREHFESGEAAVAFDNLGGDARLVVPCPAGTADAWTHIADFSRQAPAERQHGLWRLVGRELAARLGDRPVWLSTAGDAVPWLHVRLDDTPKYYRYGPWRRPAPG